MTFADLFDRGYTKPLHRFIMNRWTMPQRVDDLARRVHAKLFTVPPQTLVDAPMRCLYSLAADETDRGAVDAGQHPSTTADLLPEDQAARLQLQQLLDVAVAQLPPLQAAILLAHKRDGLSYEELQIKFGLPVAVIEKCVTHAKSQIRTMSWKDGAH